MQLKGTQLSNDEFLHGVLSVKQKPEIAYSWATGVAITKFLAGLKEGIIYGTVCNDCDRTVCPPRMFCEECFSPMGKFVELGHTAIINTFSLAYIRTDATRRDFAEIPIVVDFDDTTISPSGFLHLLDEKTDHTKIRVGSRIKAVWKEPEDRTGDITDIKYFKLLEDS